MKITSKYRTGLLFLFLACGLMIMPGFNDTASALQTDQKIYDPKGKVDPFVPLYRDVPEQSASIPDEAGRSKRPKRRHLTPLEKIDLGQLRFVGTIRSKEGYKALVEESSGKGYVVKVGTYIGRDYGVVKKIERNKILIEEEYIDRKGKTQIRTKELKLQKPPGE